MLAKKLRACGCAARNGTVAWKLVPKASYGPAQGRSHGPRKLITRGYSYSREEVNHAGGIKFQQSLGFRLGASAGNNATAGFCLDWDGLRLSCLVFMGEIVISMVERRAHPVQQASFMDVYACSQELRGEYKNEKSTDALEWLYCGDADHCGDYRLFDYL
jgi:hypothetical protein